tara:strand:+ start:492 stop:770 length:279 start_codon:yes stop_codon:yes gene_type:complete
METNNEEKTKKKYNIKPKEFKCENCNTLFNSLKRKETHYKICNYNNLEKKITDLEFKLFYLETYNEKLIFENKKYINDINILVSNISEIVDD